MKKRTYAEILAAFGVLLYALFGGSIAHRVPKDVGYIISGICGTYLVLQIAFMDFTSVLNRVMSFAGKNTLIIYGTHHIYYATLGKMLGIQNFATTPLITGMVILLGIVLLEVPTIYVINRWMPALAGKRRIH